MYKAIYYNSTAIYNKYKLATGVIQAHDPFNMVVLDTADKTPGTSTEIKNTFTFSSLDSIPANKAIIKILSGSESSYDIAVEYLKNQKVTVTDQFYNLGIIVAEIPKGSYSSFESKLSTWLTPYGLQYVELDVVHTIDPNYQIPYSEHWHLGNIQAQCAWDAMDPYAVNTDDPIPVTAPGGITYVGGCNRPEVALLDGGVEINHPDLIGRLSGGCNVNRFGESSTSLNWNCVDNNSSVIPINSFDNHGTAMAGVIAGNNLNYQYSLSASNNYLRVQVLKIMYPITTNQYYTSSTIQILAINKAVANPNCVAINMSFGSTVYSSALADAILYARNVGRDCKGIPLFASAGNYSQSNPTIYPALYDGVLPIAASTAGNFKASYSNMGDFLFAAAPGVNIITTDRVGANGYSTTTSSNSTTQYDSYYTNLATYRYFGGTSASCGIASAIAGCMVAVNPNITANQIETILADTAAQTGGYTYDPKSNELGYGVLRMCDAIQSVIDSLPDQLPTIDISTEVTSGAIASTTCSNIGVTTTVTINEGTSANITNMTLDYYASNSSAANPNMIWLYQSSYTTESIGNSAYTNDEFYVSNIPALYNPSAYPYLIIRYTFYDACGHIISDGETEVTAMVPMTLTQGCVATDAAVEIISYELATGANNSIQRRFTVRYTNTGTVPITNIYVKRGWVGGAYAYQAISGSNLSTTGVLNPGQTRTAVITFNQPVPALPATYYTQILTVNGNSDSNPGNNYASFTITA